MLKKIIYLFSALMLVLSASACSANNTASDEGITVVTSFYPMYIIAENVIGNAEGINLENMAPPQSGCLHDYQLTTGDMRRLSTADVFIINGGGMESFIEDALSLYPSLNLIDTSIGTAALEADNEHEEHSDHDHEEHEHEENSHFWILPSNAAVQAQNICTALCDILPSSADLFKANTVAFVDRLNSIPAFNGNEVKACVFNEAFEYFQLSYGMDIPICVEMDENQSPSAKELAEIITTVKEQHIQLLIAADDAGEALAKTIARETDAVVLRLDPVLMGDFDADSYVSAMTKNVEMLENAVNGGH